MSRAESKSGDSSEELRRKFAESVVASAPASETQLLLTDYHWRNIPSEPWRGFNTWKFRVKGSAETPSILQALLHDDSYAYTFAGPYPPPQKPDVRGPYVLNRLSPQSFEPISRSNLWGEVDEFLREWSRPASRSEIGLDELIAKSIDEADELLHLKHDDSYLFETSWIVQDFHEFIAIGRGAGSVLVVTTSAD